MLNFPKLSPEILYERLLKFAQKSQKLVTELPKTIYNLEYGKQLIRSSASPGANYIEAIEAGSLKEFIHRLVICRKELKESIHWSRLIKSSNLENEEIQSKADELIREAQELVKIFSSSIVTSKKNQGIKK